jgi:hypothetical protein
MIFGQPLDSNGSRSHDQNQNRRGSPLCCDFGYVAGRRQGLRSVTKYEREAGNNRATASPG